MKFFAKLFFKKALITLFIITAVVFLSFSVIPSDAATTMLGTNATPDTVEQLRHELGLDRNPVVRYFSWLGGALRGDFGISFSYKQPVSELLSGKIAVTLCLSLMSFALVCIFSIPMGIVLARYKDSWLERILSALNQVLMSVPPFFIGMVFTLLFGIILKLFTPGNFVPFKQNPGSFFMYMIFPALAIAVPKSAMTIKLLRRSILEEGDKDYLRAAYSRGNNSWQALRNHVLPNAILPVITFLAMTLADIVAGSIIIEQVFVIPGLGRLLLSAISTRDFPVVQAAVLIIAFVVVLANFLAEVLNSVIDPRIRLQ